MPTTPSYHEARKEALEKMLQEFAKAGHCIAKLCNYRNLWFLLHAMLTKHLDNKVRKGLVVMINSANYIPFLSRLFCATRGVIWYPLHIIFNFVLKIKYSVEAAKILTMFCTNYSEAFRAILSDDIPVPLYKFLTARRMSEMISTLIFPLSPEAINEITKTIRHRYEDMTHQLIYGSPLTRDPDDGDIYYDAEMSYGAWETIYMFIKDKAASLSACIRSPIRTRGGRKKKGITRKDRTKVAKIKGGSLYAVRKLTADALKHGLGAAGHLLDLIDENPIELIHALWQKKVDRSLPNVDTFVPLIISLVQWSKRFLKVYFEKVDNQIAQVLAMPSSPNSPPIPVIEKFLPVLRKYACTIGGIIDGTEKRSAINIRAIVDDIFDDAIISNQVLEAIVGFVNKSIKESFLMTNTNSQLASSVNSSGNSMACQMNAAWFGQNALAPTPRPMQRGDSVPVLTESQPHTHPPLRAMSANVNVSGLKAPNSA